MEHRREPRPAESGLNCPLYDPDAPVLNPAGINVLLVDDEPANLLALEVVLEPLGAHLVRARSGPEALRKLQDADYAAILLDVRMPGMDGFEAAKLIRSRPRSRSTPIIFVTADGSELSMEEAYAMGAVDFLTKPLVPAIIKAKVAFFIELQRGKDELRAAGRRASEERAFLTAVLEGIEDGVVACGPDGKLTLFNRATKGFHGLPQVDISPEHWAGHYDLFREDGVTPLPTAEIPLVRALAGEEVERARMVIAPRGGLRRTVEASGRPLYADDGRKLGAVVSMHDLSAVREAQVAREAIVREQARREEAEAAAELIRASQERVRLATEAGGLAVWIWDSATDTVIWEHEWLYEMFGLPRGSPPINAARFVADFLHPDDEAAFREAATATIVRSEPFYFQGRFFRQPDRDVRWLEFRGRLQHTADGQPSHVLGTAAEITDQKCAEDDLRRLAFELAESDRRKTEFLATLAHELRNPLAPLASGLQVMRLSASDPQVVERTRSMMERQVNHMVHLVNDLLDIARITTGKVELKKERVELHSIIASAVETSMPVIEAGRHELRVQVPDEVMLLEVDLTRIAQVVSNLLNNAAKYTPGRGRIGLAARREGAEVVIDVSDSGIGIPPAAMATVFEMFTQVGRNMERAQGGLGIGLSLVRRLAELHGGSVSAQSEGVGRGSTFSIRLPLLTQDPAAVPAATSIRVRDEPGAVEAGADGSLRVLVVDDNIDAADTLGALLEMNGHAIRVANDGYQAIELAQAFLPQVVFLDIGLPGMNGYEVARRLRQTPGMERGILVALTGWGTREDRERSSEAGFDHHLTKPADMATVENLLAGLTRMH
jgi:signal transduction histidine kinase/DNA-binding response OmpR family regulator